MPDARIEQYARLLVDECIDVQPGWQVLVFGSPLGRPLLEEIARQVARREAYALLRVQFDVALSTARVWAMEAPVELLERPAPLEAHGLDTADAIVVVQAPENTRDYSSLAPERLAALAKAYRPHTERMLRHAVPWVGCQFPTPSLAQDAGMSTAEFADFLYGAVLRDWSAERERMQRYAEHFDSAREVRIVGAETDLRLSLDGRRMKVDAAGANVPGGEFFGCPIEDSAVGTIAFTEYPGVLGGRDVNGIRLRFEDGQVVQASAESNEDFLLSQLDRDEGARRVGELGIGCNPGITRHMRNTLFDEKIDGTVHIALGNGFPDLGGTNVSTLHWDIVKDLRRGGSIELDGDVVQRDGVWLI